MLVVSRCHSPIFELLPWDNAVFVPELGEMNVLLGYRQKIKARVCEPLFASSNSEEPVPSKNRILAVAEVRTA